MASPAVLEIPKGGFSFENCRRNANIAANGYSTQNATKTGTTIVGIIFKDGVILGADTRATCNAIIADKNCEKIHFLAKNMYCCGAGTAADTSHVTKTVSSQLELHNLLTGRVVPVRTALRILKQYLFRYQGHVGAALVLGGMDDSGPCLYSVQPHGSTCKLPYITMGSGSLAAMAVFEDRWHKDMTLEEGKKLVRDGIAAGIFNDLGSGSYVDLCVLTKDGTDLIRPYEKTNLKGERQGTYRYKRGTTAVLSTSVIPLEVESTVGEKNY
ncbi:Proteasome subunit beta type-7 [Nymphon striatum]|nr:Proteasome subunit beta type-7 [Nymphon striatum]